MCAGGQPLAVVSRTPTPTDAMQRSQLSLPTFVLRLATPSAFVAICVSFLSCEGGRAGEGGRGGQESEPQDGVAAAQANASETVTINGRALALQGNDWSSVARELVEFSDCANDPIEFAVTPAAPAGLILRAAALVCEHRPRWFSISLKGGPTIAARAAPSRRDGLPKAEKKCAETSVTIGKQSIFVGRAQAHFSAIGSRVYDHEGTRAQGVLAFTDRLAPGSCEELESAPSRVDLQALSATVARMGAGGSDCGAIRFSATDDVSWKDAARVAQHLTASGRSLLLESEIPPGNLRHLFALPTQGRLFYPEQAGRAHARRSGHRARQARRSVEGVLRRRRERGHLAASPRGGNRLTREGILGHVADTVGLGQPMPAERIR